MEDLIKQLEKLGQEYSLLLKQKGELKSYRLQLFRVSQNFINPFLLHFNKEHSAFYENGDIYVSLDNGNTDKFYFDEDENVINAFFRNDKREELIFWFDGRFFNVAKKHDYEIHKANESKIKDNHLQIKNTLSKIASLENEMERIKFWEQYDLPFSFVVNIKPVKSGYSEKSHGDGCYGSSVYHLLPTEAIKIGRMSRKPYEYLCSQPTWIPYGEIEPHTDKKTMPKITCKECLKKIEKYKKASKD